jgi:hypothetical protein
MGFVLDASVSACWAFDDGQPAIADASLDCTLARAAEGEGVHLIG